jgi:hypothetical protein
VRIELTPEEEKYADLSKLVALVPFLACVVTRFSVRMNPMRSLFGRAPRCVSRRSKMSLGSDTGPRSARIGCGIRVQVTVCPPACVCTVGSQGLHGAAGECIDVLRIGGCLYPLWELSLRENVAALAALDFESIRARRGPGWTIAIPD